MSLSDDAALGATVRQFFQAAGYPALTRSDGTVTSEEWKKSVMILAADNIVTYGAEAATLHMTMYSAALIRILRMQGYQAALPNAEDFRGALTSEEDKDAFRQIISQQLLKSLQSQIDNLQGATKQT